MGDKSVEKTYQKKSQLEHILLRPDTYVGSTEKLDQTLWVFDEKTQKLKEKEISYAPGLYKIFDEILVNAADNIQRDQKGCTQIKVTVDKAKNQISVYNNGKTIPVVIHKEHKMYVPEMVFGHLLTSSNYDDSEKKTTGGRNGFGAKLTNIFSKKFTVEVGDSKNKKHYVQEFTNNMHNIGEPKIKEYSADKTDQTIVTFEPDFKRFGMKGLDDDIISLFKKRVYDLAGISPKSVKVYFNGDKIEVNTFEEYTGLYFTSKQSDIQRFCEKFGNRWEVCVAIRDFEQFQQVSFVNGICTVRGGTHVNHVADQIVSNLLDVVMKKNKKLQLKPFQIKSHLWVFVNCLIENPAFDSQTKETLTSRPNTFGSKCEITDKFLQKVAKSGVIDEIIQRAEQKEQNKLKRELGTGTKKKKLFGIPKLEDANWAGTQDSDQCVLILTEGDSAKSLAMSGIQVVGRDKYGVFPLRGKLLNVRDASNQQVLQNQEIQSIIKILGLYIGRQYQSRDDLKTLRYGSIMIMADQDHDGSHIKGLIINFLHHFWPSLLINFRNFVKVFITPIIKVSKDREQHQFFTIPEYEKWAKSQDLNDLRKYRVKYYKGLGTSTAQEAKQYFSAINKHQIQYFYQCQKDEDKILLAFSKQKVDDRKDWLSKFDPHDYIDYSKQRITYSEFVDKELIHFSNADNLRSIPSVMDGLKPGQRKIIYGCFKRKLKQEIKVAQLSGYIAEHTAYHHGEVSLQSTIVIMAQDFVGSNNLNLLMPIGQFGTRMQGGKESASPRYIFTNLSPFTRMIFNENDDPLLNYQIEEGLSIEPEFYAPIVPMVLINGAEGIGTGWSTWIPCYSPIQIIHNLKRHLEGKPFLRMIPWYKGFRGEIVPNDEDYHSFTVRGLYNVDDYKRKLSISELPIGKWTRDYKTMLEEMAQKDEILDIKEFHQDNTVDFQLKCADSILKVPEAELIKKFKLTSTLNATNLVLFDKDYKLKKYENECEILQEFFEMRLQLYHKRKENMLRNINQQFEKMSNKYRFIQEIMDGSLNIYKKKKEEIVRLLKTKGFKTYQDIYGKQSKSILAVDSQNQDFKMDGSSKKDASKQLNKKEDYNYLLEMKIYSFVEDQLHSLKAKMDEIGKQKAELEKKSAKDLWNEDLDLLLEKYEASLSFEDKRQHRKLMEQKQKEYIPTKKRENGKMEEVKSTPLWSDDRQEEEVKNSSRKKRVISDEDSMKDVNINGVEEQKQTHRSVVRLSPEKSFPPQNQDDPQSKIVNSSRKVVEAKIQTPLRQTRQQSKQSSPQKQEPTTEKRILGKRSMKAINYREKEDSSEEEYQSSESSENEPQSLRKDQKKSSLAKQNKQDIKPIKPEPLSAKKGEAKLIEKSKRKLQRNKDETESMISNQSLSQSSDYQVSGQRSTTKGELMQFFPQRQTRSKGGTTDNISAPLKNIGSLTPKKLINQSANLSANISKAQNVCQSAITISQTANLRQLDLEQELNQTIENDKNVDKTMKESLKLFDDKQIMNQSVQGNQDFNNKQTSSEQIATKSPAVQERTNDKPLNLLDKLLQERVDSKPLKQDNGITALNKNQSDLQKSSTKQSTLNFLSKTQQKQQEVAIDKKPEEKKTAAQNIIPNIHDGIVDEEGETKTLRERIAAKRNLNPNEKSTNEMQELIQNQPEITQPKPSQQHIEQVKEDSPINNRRKVRKILDEDD